MRERGGGETDIPMGRDRQKDKRTDRHRESDRDRQTQGQAVCKTGRR